MTISVGSASNTPLYGSHVNSVIVAPTGISNGDLLVAVLHVGDSTVVPPLAVTPPAGWTEVTNSPVAASKPDPYTIALHVYYKVASSESGNYTFTHTVADTEGYMYRLTGVDTTTPIEATPVTQIANGTSNGKTTGYGTLTTITNGAFLIYAESDWDTTGSAAVSGTTPTILVRRNGSIDWIGDGTLATAGATGARTRTNGNTLVSLPWVSIVVPIRPSGVQASAVPFVPTPRQYLRMGATPPPPGVPVVTPASFTVPPNPTLNQSIGTVSATNSPTSFAIVAGDPTGKFAITAAGNLRTAATGTPPAAGNYSLSVTATNATGTSTPATVSVTVSASSGTAQHPTLLNSYPFRPSWQVAGVDFYVGCPTGIALNDPNTLVISGVSVNTTNKTVTVTGNNVTIDSYDFSLNGGWGVITSAANTIVQNCKFSIGANGNGPVHGNASATNLTVGNCTINGNGIDIGATGLIQTDGIGIIVHHCWLMNSGGDTIQAHRGGVIDLRYNMIEEGGWTTGAHGDFLETYSNDNPELAFTATILYNTTYQYANASAHGATQGFMLEPDVGPKLGIITSGEYGFNTFVSTGGNQNYHLGVTVADIVNTVTMHDNYFDDTGCFGFSPGNSVRSGPNDGSTKTIFTNNVRMTTGAIIQDTGP